MIIIIILSQSELQVIIQSNFSILVVPVQYLPQSSSLIHTMLDRTVLQE